MMLLYTKLIVLDEFYQTKERKYVYKSRFKKKLVNSLKFKKKLKFLV